MPLYTDTTKNIINNTTGQWDARDIKSNDQSVVSSTDYVSAFKIRVGKHQRVLWKADLYWDYGAGDLKYKILIPSGIGTKGFRLLEERSELPIDGVISWDPHVHYNNTGRGEASFEVGTGFGYFRLQGTFENGPNAGDIDIQFTQRVSNAEATILKAGSYIEYIKF